MSKAIFFYAGILSVIFISVIVAQQPPSEIPEAIPLDREILSLRRKELNTETRIERLRIDIQAIEKKWQEARETETESRLLIDSTSNSALKTQVLWEQLSTNRADLENAVLLLDCYRRQRMLMRLMSNKHNDTIDRYDHWKVIIDSTISLRSILKEECRWRKERLDESTFELAALDTLLSGTVSQKEDRRLLQKRRIYLENRIASDSILRYHGTLLDSLLSGYQQDAAIALKQITISQKTRRLYRKIIGIWFYRLYEVDGKPLTVGKVIVALFVILAGLKSAQIISRLIAQLIKRKTQVDAGIVDAGQKLFFYTFTAFFTLYALHMLQVPLTAFTVIGGALALGFGFGSQNIIKNFISGIILLLERPMKTGDFLEIDGAVGTVESIGLRSTRIKTPDNVHMVIPNSSFLEKNVVNWTLSDRLIRLDLTVGIQYGSSVTKAKELLLQSAEQSSRVLLQPAPEVFFSDFGDNALILNLMVWVRLRNIIDRRRILSELRFFINELFHTSGIVIAYPQRDVHLDMPAPMRVRLEKVDVLSAEETVR